MSHAAQVATTARTPMSIDWTALIAKHGFTTILAGAVVWFVAYQVVIPMRDDQRRFMDSVIETNKQRAATEAQAIALQTQTTQIQQTQTATLATQSSTLSNLVDQQKQTTNILQQIRDDQRSGAWLKAKVASDP